MTTAPPHPSTQAADAKEKEAARTYLAADGTHSAWAGGISVE